jgi:DNA-binding transcriptional ArsR family regulator
VLKAPADPTRWAILGELPEFGSQTVFVPCVRLTTTHGRGLPSQAISQHLAMLESAGVVNTRCGGRYTHHDLDTTPMGTIVER